MEHLTSDRYYSFGPYVLDRLRGVLWHDGLHVQLTPRVFEILVALVRHPGELLTKDDFMRLVWAGAAVEDNNLARHVSTLRKVLHERPGQRDYIATVPGSGYRFVATVTVLAALPADLASPSPPVPTHPAPSPSTPVPVQVHVSPAGNYRSQERKTAAAMKAAPTGGSPGPSGTPIRRARLSWPRTLLAAGAVAVALVLVGALSAPKVRTSAPVQRSLWQFTHESGSQEDPSWSPDGARVAFASDEAGSSDIWVRGLADLEATRLTSAATHERQPDWSPDGSRLAFRIDGDEGGLHVMPAAGGPAQRISTFGSRPRWSRKGDLILFAHAAAETAAALRMFVVGLDGQPPRPVSHPELTGLRVVSADWAPDGRVSFWAIDDGGGRVFVTIPLDGGPAVRSSIPGQLARDSAEVGLSGFVWAPSWRYLYFEGTSQSVRNIWRIAVDPRTLAWTQDPERLTAGPGTTTGITLSRDGTKLGFGLSTAHTGLWTFPFDHATGRIDGQGRPVTPGEAGERGGDASADGTRVAFRFARNDREEIWERSSGAGPRMLVSEADWLQSAPQWSPDGTRIAYQRSPRPGREQAGGKRAVAILEVGGRQQKLLDLGGADSIVPADWTQDGRAILASCRLEAGDRFGTCLLPLPHDGSAGRLRRLAYDERVDQVQQRYSPDQKWISFLGTRRGDRSVTTLYVMPAAGGPWVRMSDGSSYDDKPRWSPDGRSLYFVSNRDGRCEVWAVRFDPDSGTASGLPFRVSSFARSGRVLYLDRGRMEMSVTPTAILLPMQDASARVWILDQVDE